MEDEPFDPLAVDDGLPRLVLVATPAAGEATRYAVTAYRYNLDDEAVALEMLAGVLPAAAAAVIRIAQSTAPSA